MYFFGRPIGAFIGYVSGGWVGAIIGFIAGYFFVDQHLASARVRRQNPQQTQRSFFEATFLVLGHVAKADGRVSADEIAAAEQVMDKLGLTVSQRREAIAFFNEGKRDDFDLNRTMLALRRDCGNAPNLLLFFLEIQMQMALADGQVHQAEEAALMSIGQKLGLSMADLQRLRQAIQAQQQFSSSGAGQRGAGGTTKAPIGSAYAVLGVAKTASDADVKRAYRKLMSQHHPDKLAAKGLPPEMLKIAEQKSQQITAAYNQIKQARGMK